MKIVSGFLLYFFFVSSGLHAQQNHFIFIQTESRQPFNITVNKKVYSSTATGYVIVPKLSAGNYSIAIAFGGNAITDQYFNIDLNLKDAGFTLKNMEQKGWALTDLQNQQTIFAGNSAGKAAEVAVNNNHVSVPVPNTSNRSFQPEVNVPAQVNTSTKEETVPLSPPKKNEADKNSNTKIESGVSQPVFTEINKPVVESKSTNIINVSSNSDNALIDQRQEKATNINPKIFPQRIKKISELKGGEAIYITYVDELQQGNDTINVLIPDNKAQPAITQKSADKDILQFLEIGSPKSKDSSTISNKQKSVENVVTNSTPKSAQCIASASNDDFLKLRKKMAAATDNDIMVMEAKKAFKTMCFSTEQIKNLAYLFLNDQSRYQFLDAAYPYVSDVNNFNALVLMISDDYYVRRFKAMMKE